VAYVGKLFIRARRSRDRLRFARRAGPSGISVHMGHGARDAGEPFRTWLTRVHATVRRRAVTARRPTAGLHPARSPPRTPGQQGPDGLKKNPRGGDIQGHRGAAAPAKDGVLVLWPADVSVMPDRAPDRRAW